MSTINLKKELLEINEHWSPSVISKINNCQIKIAKIKGEYIWHSHENTDELFYIISGSMRIELRDKIIELNKGDIYVVAKGVEHKPIAEHECHILLIEKTENTKTNFSEVAKDLMNKHMIWV